MEREDAELKAVDETWEQLGRIAPIAPDLPAMRTRFDLALAGYHDTRRRSKRVALTALAVAASLVVGVGIGRQTLRPATRAADAQMTAMQGEIRELRQMMSLSLLQQPSAAARLQGIISMRRIDNADGEIISALLDTLTYDPNANVRLGAIDALQRYVDREPVRRGALQALPQQTSPLVQIALIDFLVESAGVESAEALRTLSESASAAAVVRAHAVEALRTLRVQS